MFGFSGLSGTSTTDWSEARAAPSSTRLGQLVDHLAWAVRSGGFGARNFRGGRRGFGRGPRLWRLRLRRNLGFLRRSIGLFGHQDQNSKRRADDDRADHRRRFWHSSRSGLGSRRSTSAHAQCSGALRSKRSQTFTPCQRSTGGATGCARPGAARSDPERPGATTTGLPASWVASSRGSQARAGRTTWTYYRDRGRAIDEGGIFGLDGCREHGGIADIMTRDREDDRVFGETETLDRTVIELGDDRPGFQG